MAKKVVKVIGVIAACFILILAVGMFYMTRGLSQTRALTIDDVDLTQISDGVYTGAFTGYRWSNTVEVTVSNQTITEIEVVDKQRIHMEEEITRLLERVVAAQSLEVDMISGGTVSSKAILKAVENALTLR